MVAANGGEADDKDEEEFTTPVPVPSILAKGKRHGFFERIIEIISKTN